MDTQPRVQRRAEGRPGPSVALLVHTADHMGEETTLVVGTLTYAGTGWRSTGDALLANTAAALARQHRHVAREETACAAA